jgi:4-hydroxybenzoate polyprenyltransferase
MSSLESWKILIIAFFSFNLCASSNYIFNDILDIENDRIHPRKKYRPLASNYFKLYEAICFAILFLFISIYLASFQNILFGAVLFTYLLIAQIYSFKIKRLHILDCITLSILYIMRLIAGAVAVNLTISFWLLSFSLFFFFSLALLKRYSELANHSLGKGLNFGRSYKPSDMPLILCLGVPSSLLSILVIGLYLNDEKIYFLYEASNVLFLLLLTSLTWVSLIWSKAYRGVEINDPISFALKDFTSLILFFISILIFIIARFGMPSL